MEKDDRYAFRVNKELKTKFKNYCRVMNVSPSDVLSEVMMDFNNVVDEIIKMKNIDELQAMVQGKFTSVQNELDLLKAKRK
jgi:hypothetical protein